MVDNHSADEHVCFPFTLKVNDVCWQGEWRTDEGLKAPMPDVHSILGVVVFSLSVPHISLPNFVYKAGLRAPRAGCMLPRCSAPTLLLLLACFSQELWVPRPTVLGRSQNLWVKICVCSTNLSLKNIMERRPKARSISTCQALGLAVLDWVHLLSVWYGDTKGYLTCYQWKGMDWVRRHLRSKGNPESKICLLSALLSQFLDIQFILSLNTVRIYLLQFTATGLAHWPRT